MVSAGNPWFKPPHLFQLATIVVWQPEIQLFVGFITDHYSITDHLMTGPLSIKKLVAFVSIESQNLRQGFLGKKISHFHQEQSLSTNLNLIHFKKSVILEHGERRKIMWKYLY